MIIAIIAIMIRRRADIILHFDYADTPRRHFFDAMMPFSRHLMPSVAMRYYFSSR